MILVVGYSPAAVLVVGTSIILRAGEAWDSVLRAAKAQDQDVVQDLTALADRCERDVVVNSDLPEDIRGHLYLFCDPC